MNQSELIAAYKYLDSVHGRLIDIQTLSRRLDIRSAQGEVQSLMQDLLPLIGQSVVDDQ